MGCVYMATCLPNGKKYIGKTKGSLTKRKIQHRSFMRTNLSCLFHKALHKYGEDSFKWEILFQHDDESILYEKEKELIAAHNTVLPNGYNMTTGGDGLYNVMFSDSWREKNQKRADALGKPVYCLETDTVYLSVAEAARKTGSNSSTISHRCNSENKRSIDLHFCFATNEAITDLKQRSASGLLKLTKSPEAVAKMRAGLTGQKRSKEFCEKRRQYMLEHNPWKGKKLPREAVEKMRKNRKGKCMGAESGAARAITNIDTGESFDAMIEAINHYGLPAKASANIGSCCRGQLRTAYGFHWKYRDKEVDIPQGE